VARLIEMPKVFTFALADVVAEDVPLSKGKARKAIVRGKVSVDGVVVRDPETRVHGDSKIVFKP
jgi:16S rRNA U516 pseudouridylate synthase RsuA-like enzyme